MSGFGINPCCCGVTSPCVEPFNFIAGNTSFAEDKWTLIPSDLERWKIFLHGDFMIQSFRVMCANSTAGKAVVAMNLHPCYETDNPNTASNATPNTYIALVDMSTGVEDWVVRIGGGVGYTTDFPLLGRSFAIDNSGNVYYAVLGIHTNDYLSTMICGTGTFGAVGTASCAAPVYDPYNWQSTTGFDTQMVYKFAAANGALQWAFSGGGVTSLIQKASGVYVTGFFETPLYAGSDAAACGFISLDTNGNHTEVGNNFMAWSGGTDDALYCLYINGVRCFVTEKVGASFTIIEDDGTKTEVTNPTNLGSSRGNYIWKSGTNALVLFVGGTGVGTTYANFWTIDPTDVASGWTSDNTLNPNHAYQSDFNEEDANLILLGGSFISYTDKTPSYNSSGSAGATLTKPDETVAFCPEDVPYVINLLGNDISSWFYSFSPTTIVRTTSRFAMALDDVHFLQDDYTGTGTSAGIQFTCYGVDEGEFSCYMTGSGSATLSDGL